MSDVPSYYYYYVVKGMKRLRALRMKKNAYSSDEELQAFDDGNDDLFMLNQSRRSAKDETNSYDQTYSAELPEEFQYRKSYVDHKIY